MLSFRIKHSCFSFKELTSCVETPLKDLTNTSWHATRLKKNILSFLKEADGVYV
jgi:hypothetical protein